MQAVISFLAWNQSLWSNSQQPKARGNVEHLVCKDLFIKILTSTVVKLLLMLYDFLRISLYIPVKWMICNSNHVGFQNFECKDCQVCLLYTLHG